MVALSTAVIAFTALYIVLVQSSHCLLSQQKQPEDRIGREVDAHPGLVWHEQVLLAGLAQDLAEHLDGLAASKQEGHGNARHTRHLHVVVHVHELVHQALRQIRVLRGHQYKLWQHV